MLNAKVYDRLSCEMLNDVCLGEFKTPVKPCVGDAIWMNDTQYIVKKVMIVVDEVDGVSGVIEYEIYVDKGVFI